MSSGNILLGEGFVPSGALIKALMTLSGDSLEGGRQAELVLGEGPDNQQGWRRVNLSNLVDFEKIEEILGMVILNLEKIFGFMIHLDFMIMIGKG